MSVPEPSPGPGPADQSSSDLAESHPEPFSLAGYEFPILFGKPWLIPAALAVVAVMLIMWLGIFSGGESGEGGFSSPDRDDETEKDPAIVQLVAAINSPN